MISTLRPLGHRPQVVILLDLLYRQRNGELDRDVVTIISNHPADGFDPGRDIERRVLSRAVALHLDGREIGQRRADGNFRD